MSETEENDAGQQKSLNSHKKKKIIKMVRNNMQSIIGIGILACISIIIVVVGVVVIKKTDNFKENVFDRLPLDVLPTSYIVEIHPFFENYTFHTRVNVTFTVHAPTKYLILNAFMLENLTASIYGPIILNNVPVSWARKDVIRLTSLVELTAGNYTLAMECDGLITDDLLGLYRSKYVVSNTIYPYLLTTKLESSSARKVFPCWDEPMFKAKFTIILIGPISQRYVCNMPIQSEIVAPWNSSEIIVTFAETPLMSTYLIAFVIGELSQIEQIDEFDTLQRVIVPKGSAAKGELALKTGLDSIKFLSIYFKRFFPLPKLDMVAVRDFQSGAMEHWGMVTYREARLLPEANSPVESRVGVVTTICHENAHMWFGDLVTMKWWNDLWLNEGFATWIEALCTEYLHPEFEMWNRFLFGEVKSAMLLDSIKTTHPVIVNVPNTDNIRVIYNAISYRKGASILRMLDQYVEPEIFQQALQKYIEVYAYQNTITKQLWDQVSLASNKDINSFMEEWTNRPGFPFIQIISQEKINDTLRLTLKQNRFFADGSTLDEFETIWKIPIGINSASNSHSTKWKIFMDSQTQIFDLPGAINEKWIKLNFEKSAFIITMYTEEMLETLYTAVQNKELNSLDRFDIESDLYMLSSAGHILMSEYLNFTHVFYHDTDFTIWTDISNNVQTLGMLVEYMHATTKITVYGFVLFRELYQFIGISPSPGESSMIPALRALALQDSALYGYLSSEEFAYANFQAAMYDSNFQADLREPVFIINVNKRGQTSFFQMKAYYLRATTTDEQRMALVSMGYTSKAETMQDLLDMICFTGEIRLQDISYPLRRLGITKLGRDFVWEYTKINIDQIKTVIPMDYLIQNYINSAFGGYGVDSIIPEMEQFFIKNEIPLNHTIIIQLFDQIRINAAIVIRSRDDVINYLESLTIPSLRNSKR